MVWGGLAVAACVIGIFLLAFVTTDKPNRALSTNAVARAIHGDAAEREPQRLPVAAERPAPPTRPQVTQRDPDIARIEAEAEKREAEEKDRKAKEQLRHEDEERKAEEAKAEAKTKKDEAAAQALLKIGRMFQRDGDVDLAILRYKKILAEYPNTKAAEEAKAILKALGR